MILNHLIGIYTHPKEEWQTIDTKHETYFYALTHIAFISLIPSLVAYYSSAHTGWSIGAGDIIRLSENTAIMMGIGMYFGLIAGVVALAYTATPLFMVGFAGLYPELWVVMTALLVGISYSVYLLYSGVPILMHMPEDKGFIYSSSVVTCGLVLLVILMTGSVLVWGLSGGPVFVH